MERTHEGRGDPVALEHLGERSQRTQDPHSLLDLLPLHVRDVEWQGLLGGTAAG